MRTSHNTGHKGNSQAARGNHFILTFLPWMSLYALLEEITIGSWHWQQSQFSEDLALERPFWGQNDCSKAEKQS